MKKVFILCENFLNCNLTEYSIGGIETYISNLVNVIKEMGLNVCILQFANINKEIEIDGITIIGIDTHNIKEYKGKKQKLHERFIMESTANESVLIYATEGLIEKKYANLFPSVAIQHGISWDKPKEETGSKIKEWFDFFFYSIVYKRAINRMCCVKCVVCVDYNYVNWYRTMDGKRKANLTVIPNFTRIPEKYSKECDTLKIIFARRFQQYRGTRLFINAIKRILDEFSNVDITIAGDGPDEEWMKENLPESNKVHYIRYENKDSLKIHKDKNIAIIPTTGSEGTSLSLLEAMACNCAVICTNVGGLTNIVIDEFNGLIINPICEDLYLSIRKLIENDELRNLLSNNAYNTVKYGFSYDLWSEKWKHVLNDFF